MRNSAAAALTAAMLAGTATVALAETATTTTPAPATTAQPASPTKTAPMSKATQRVAARRFEPAGDPDTKALNLLEAAGYTDIKSFRAVGARFEASVDQNGKLITVTVDPGTGRITNRA